MYCTKHGVFVDYGDPCPVCMNDLDEPGAPQTAKAGSKPILCLDFDGVCHSYTSGWQGAATIPDPPVPGLEAFLIQALPHFDVAIFSARSGQVGGIDAMKAWFSYWYPRWKTWNGVLSFPTNKPSAMLTIDDRAVCFEGVWPDVHVLKTFKPWYKR